MRKAPEEQVSTDAIGLVTAKPDGVIDGFFFQLPNIIAGLGLLFVAWLAGRFVAPAAGSLPAADA